MATPTTFNLFPSTFGASEKRQQTRFGKSMMSWSANMRPFIVFMREKTLDQAELEIYWSKIRATLEGRPIKILAAYGRHVTLEGPEVEGAVVAEFPSVEEARAWYDSPSYRAAAEHRFRGAVYRGLIVEGV